MDDRLRNQIVVGTASGLVSFGIGAAVGYILGKRQQKFIHAVPAEEVPDQNWTLADLASVPELIKAEDIVVLDEAPGDVDLASVIGKQMVEARLKEIEEIDDEYGLSNAKGEEPERQNIFSNIDDHWDYDEELKTRSIQEPYVIHRDEFYNEESDNYAQTTITWYEGDNVAVDQEDTPIYNHHLIIGPMKFGHGSGDQNVFYVRNDKLKAEYEIIKDGGHYSVEVLGYELEETARSDLQHSGDKKFKKD